MIPERIYLQVDPEDDPEDILDPGYSLDGTTWCAEKISDDDIEYIRISEYARVVSDLKETGEILAINRRAVRDLNDELAALKEQTRWFDYPKISPADLEAQTEQYSDYWCEYGEPWNDDNVYRGVCSYNFSAGRWEKEYDDGEIYIPIVFWFTRLPEPPEGA